jgi:hypothetical protein
MTKDVLEEDLQRDGCPIELDPAVEDRQSDVTGETGPEIGPGIERIGSEHASSEMRYSARYTRCVEEYRERLRTEAGGPGSRDHNAAR